LEVYINSILIGTANPTTTASSTTINSLNITGAFNLEIRQVTTGLRIAIDDISWTGNNNNPPCTEPSAQPTALNLSSTPTSISGNFTASASNPDSYVIIRSLSGTLSANPVDGTVYTNGQSLGGGIVVGVTSVTNFMDMNLTASTLYYYFVCALNDQDCTGGPNYLQTGALTGNTSTSALPACTTPSVASSLALTPSNNFIAGSFSVAAGANRYLTVISTNSTLSAAPINGLTYTAGQLFGGGMVVSFATATSFTATGLNTNTTYYLFVFSANAECSGEPFYNSIALSGSALTTNSSSGIPVGFYDAANGQTCQTLKTTLKTISTNGYTTLSYTPGVWNAYQYTDIKPGTSNTIWDIYTDDNDPSVPETYTFIYNTNQCGNYNSEGDCYNREHTTPQSWFNSASPMVSDVHHLFPTDGWVNGKRSNFPYGEVTNATFTSIDNQSKLGSGNNFGYTGTVFEPINAFKGDLARVYLYMATRYEDQIISQNWAGNAEANPAMLTSGEQTDAAIRRLQVYETWYLKTMFKWLNQDPVSQKEIDRNNAIYYQSGQNNRNPFVDHPEYAALVWQCTGVVPVTITDFTAFKYKESVQLKWFATYETNFKLYEIERSTDGVHFLKIGEMEGRNLANYAFTDNDLPKGSIVYYRLKMIDMDASYRNSKTVAVRLNNNFSNALVYPNPTHGMLNIKLVNAITSTTTLVITDIAGRLVKQQTLVKGQLSIDMDVHSLSAGRYFIKINDQKSMINESFVVIK
jgi:endonuclease I